MRLVDDRVAEWAGSARTRVRVRRWVAENGVKVHRYTFLGTPYTVPLRLAHLLAAREGPQIVIVEWG
ncbi:MAG: hypothetical protein QXZ31_11835 [Thermofilaceae archaeon]